MSPAFISHRQSGYAVAYALLHKARERTGAPLRIDIARQLLANATGILVRPGTTDDDILKMLEGWKLVTRGRQTIDVLPLR